MYPIVNAISCRGGAPVSAPGAQKAGAGTGAPPLHWTAPTLGTLLPKSVIGTKFAPQVPNANPNSIYAELGEKGEEDYYTFTGNPGQRIYLDRLFLDATDNWRFSANIFSPSGTNVLGRSLVYAHDPEPIILKEAGTYRVEIDASGENTGSYSFGILDLGLATAIDKDTTVSGTLATGQETHFYTFDGTEGERLYLNSPGGTSGTSFRETLPSSLLK